MRKRTVGKIKKHETEGRAFGPSMRNSLGKLQKLNKTKVDIQLSAYKLAGIMDQVRKNTF